MQGCWRILYMLYHWTTPRTALMDEISSNKHSHGTDEIAESGPRTSHSLRSVQPPRAPGPPGAAGGWLDNFPALQFQLLPLVHSSLSLPVVKSRWAAHRSARASGPVL